MRKPVVCLLLAAVTIAVYWPARSLDFVNFDDEGYVYENPQVLKGLSWDNVRWAFAATELANYHPLTWISYQLDVSLFGVRPAAYHVENVLWHVANTVLVFLLLAMLTGNVNASALAAAVFGVHPLHVESVAWVSERKDVLSAFFFLLTVMSYVVYVRATDRSRRGWAYAAVVLCFVLGLLAKPMIVTLPFVLLLLDYWPLRRTWNRWIVVEKLPLLVIAAASSWVTVHVQGAGGAMINLESLPLRLRVANVAVSYVRYLGKFVWPTRLSIFYPLSHDWPIVVVAGAVGTLAVITIFAVVVRRRAPYLPVGWFLFLGTLVPVIGLVQVGWQSIADRYMYLPMLGLAIMFAWAVADALASRAALAAIGGAVVVALSIVTVRQLQFWRDTRSLFEHALAVTNENALAHVQLGYLEAHLGHPDEARRHYEEALRIDPTYYVSAFNLGNLLLGSRPDEAVTYYRRAASSRPDDPRVQNNFGIALMVTGQAGEAAEHFRAAAALKPDFPDPLSNLGFLYLSNGDAAAAERAFSAALAIDPDFDRAKRGLARIRAASTPPRD